MPRVYTLSLLLAVASCSQANKTDDSRIILGGVPITGVQEPHYLSDALFVGETPDPQKDYALEGLLECSNFGTAQDLAETQLVALARGENSLLAFFYSQLKLSESILPNTLFSLFRDDPSAKLLWASSVSGSEQKTEVSIGWDQKHIDVITRSDSGLPPDLSLPVALEQNPKAPKSSGLGQGFVQPSLKLKYRGSQTDELLLNIHYDPVGRPHTAQYLNRQTGMWGPALHCQGPGGF